MKNTSAASAARDWSVASGDVQSRFFNSLTQSMLFDAPVLAKIILAKFA
jgi:hypothetical protein